VVRQFRDKFLEWGKNPKKVNFLPNFADKPIVTQDIA
jgi:hypothetical protein